MKNTITVLVFIFTLNIISLAQAGWAYLHVNSRQNNWQANIENFVNKARPQIDGIRAGLSHGVDFHIWVRKDGDGPVYNLQCIRPANWGPDVQDMIERKEIAVVGFNMESPPCMWVFKK